MTITYIHLNCTRLHGGKAIGMCQDPIIFTALDNTSSLALIAIQTI